METTSSSTTTFSLADGTIFSNAICFFVFIVVMMVTVVKAWSCSDLLKTARARTDSFVEEHRKRWDDLAYPFSMADDETLALDQPPEDFDGRVVTHFCFLSHGHRGMANDLSYLKTTMRKKAVLETLQKKDDNDNPIRHEIVIHSAVSNEGKTNDGVVNGGERLLREMVEVVRNEMKFRRQKQGIREDVTISIVGNSLGGIYGRYAIAMLKARLSNVNDDTRTDSNEGTREPDTTTYLDLDGEYKIYYNIFCSTASPHLGISEHTYFPISRAAENIIGKAMGFTGHDLFRLNDLMKEMGTTPKFLDALGAFRKRVAYANAYGTDFAVPGETAAFLSKHSQYPHYLIQTNTENDEEGNGVVLNRDGMIVATLETPTVRGDKGVQMNEEHADDLAKMSNSLDALGWKKVFVDLRNEIPSVPTLLQATKSGSMSAEEEQDRTSLLKEMQERKVVPSRDLVSAFAESDDDRITIPLGHNMICAHSRSRLSTFVNKSGRPLMDKLAGELIEDILCWSRTNINNSQRTL